MSLNRGPGWMNRQLRPRELEDEATEWQGHGAMMSVSACVVSILSALCIANYMMGYRPADGANVDLLGREKPMVCVLPDNRCPDIGSPEWEDFYGHYDRYWDLTGKTSSAEWEWYYYCYDRQAGEEYIDSDKCDSLRQAGAW